MPHQSKNVTDLVTVFPKCRFHGSFHASRKWTGTTQITLSLLRNANVAVTGARRTVHDLAGRRNAESFLGALVGLHLVGSHVSLCQKY